MATPLDSEAQNFSLMQRNISADNVRRRVFQDFPPIVLSVCQLHDDSEHHSRSSDASLPSSSSLNPVMIVQDH